ncbi:transposase [Flammeovirga kamogawensis]|uniref:Transposase n=1 Tax=Flammeovirga kamogawensis TaxID=373891 RepID=A0ABX8GYY2_9BACT|nr:transposase [Flammeovirga kamogawensis]MBB6459059.1 hypothetical protein [Flammeovirga kamogawensis]QWG08628.1 hypothetical protein KM029_06740 [Flammeovirga kamogawensis]TRX66921.1 transposase [Flammeovirga kamogawensis]
MKKLLNEHLKTVLLLLSGLTYIVFLIVFFLKKRYLNRVKIKTSAIHEVEKGNLLDKEIQQKSELCKILNSKNSLLQEKIGQLEKENFTYKEKVSYSSLLSFNEFIKLFPTEKYCLEVLDNLKWEHCYSCKKCGHHLYSKTDKGRRCKKCNYVESERINTIFHRVKIPLQKSFYILYFIFYNKNNVNVALLAENTEMRYNTCLCLVRKIQKIIESHNDDIFLNPKGWKKIVLLDRLD